ncbi:MAG TPA: hypothetical protein VJA82_03860 [Sediminibacterium sp.]|uniref:hypothetical protein n=1 Tax=Sediminibacterium sp. TaxID=1917865 RepID=UPI0008D824DE|nr:hypothetical protein [Sediminibacterium sp.]OHC84741.1 MAG: hypothetical protein A2472_12090 [Sphingobacteriia bacterium RIFOXYC2_FULL_35_18]OHC89199.1 MAG: hypothetical protein A2546_00095 [Sphingobacteriia bacterium RIFOXYD2_FULL_35_12]HLD52414.1 hypothetical protein [Sediminibacterium sp.]
MKSKLLADHKQTGKLFQPPLLTLGTFVETAWLDFGIPEFIWIHILCEECGIDEGSILFLEFTKISDKYFSSKTNNGTASTLISSYSILSEDDKIQIIKALKKNGLLSRLKYILSPFLFLYPNCPLNFILEQDIANNLHKEYLFKYKEYLEKLTDKTSFESTIVMANVVSFLNHLNRLKIAQGNNFPDFKEVLDYPETENSKRIASFLRSTISMCFNKEWDYNRDNEWIKYFWNQSYRLEPFKI